MAIRYTREQSKGLLSGTKYHEPLPPTSGPFGTLYFHPSADTYTASDTETGNVAQVKHTNSSFMPNFVGGQAYHWDDPTAPIRKPGNVNKTPQPRAYQGRPGFSIGTPITDTNSPNYPTTLFSEMKPDVFDIKSHEDMSSHLPTLHAMVASLGGRSHGKITVRRNVRNKTIPSDTSVDTSRGEEVDPHDVKMVKASMEKPVKTKAKAEPKAKQLKLDLR